MNKYCGSCQNKFCINEDSYHYGEKTNCTKISHFCSDFWIDEDDSRILKKINTKELAKKYNMSYASLYYHVKKYNIENEKELKEHLEKKKETKELCFFRVEKDIKNKIENYSSDNFSKNVRELILIGLEKSGGNKN